MYAAIASIREAIDKDPKSEWRKVSEAQCLAETIVRPGSLFNDKVTAMMCDALVNYVGAGPAVFGVVGITEAGKEWRYRREVRQLLQNHDSRDWMFFAAVSSGNSTFVSEYLLAYKEAHKTGNEPRSAKLILAAFCTAARAGQAGIVLALLQHGTASNYALKIGKRLLYINTPLVSAAERGHVEVVRLLLRPEWGLNRYDDQYERAIVVAALNECGLQRRAMIHVLFTEVEQLRQPIARTLALFAACFYNDTILAKSMLDHGPVDIFTKERLFWNEWPLIVAIERGNVECIELIVQSRDRWAPASVDWRFFMFSRAFNVAEEKQNVQLFKALIPAYNHWSAQRKLVEANNIDGALEMAFHLFGPYDLESKLEYEIERQYGILGPYLLNVATERCKVRNVEYLLKLGVRIEKCEGLASFRRYYDSAEEVDCRADEIEDLLKHYNIPVTYRRWWSRCN